MGTLNTWERKSLSEFKSLQGTPRTTADRLFGRCWAFWPLEWVFCLTDAKYSAKAVRDTFPRTPTQPAREVRDAFSGWRRTIKGPYPKVAGSNRIEIVWLDLKITDEFQISTWAELKQTVCRCPSMTIWILGTFHGTGVLNKTDMFVRQASECCTPSRSDLLEVQLPGDPCCGVLKPVVLQLHQCSSTRSQVLNSNAACPASVRILDCSQIQARYMVILPGKIKSYDMSIRVWQ